MKTKLVILLVIVTLLLTACKPAAQQSTIAISGAFALYPMMTVWTEEYTKVNPDVQFDLSAGGAGKGMTDALSGAVEIGMISREISAEEEAQDAYWVPVVIDAVFPTISAQNPVLATLLSKPMTQEVFTKIFITGEYKTWGDVVGDPSITDEIHVFTRSDACGAADTWAKYMGGKQEDLLGIGVGSDPALLDAVINDPLGIGYNNLNYAFDITTGNLVTGAIVAPIDVNGNGTAEPEELLETTNEAIDAVATGKYPAPPARNLHLVTKGKPSGITRAFIEWILTDGQQYVTQSGYILLTEAQITDALAKVK